MCVPVCALGGVVVEVDGSRWLCASVRLWGTVRPEGEEIVDWQSTGTGSRLEHAVGA